LLFELGIHSVRRDEVPEIRDFLTNIIRWGEWEKAIIFSSSVRCYFVRALSKYFYGKDDRPS